MKGTLFLSSVSQEFRQLRQAIASRYRDAGWTVRVQEDLKTSGGLTLEKLWDEIRACDVVICLIGFQSGSVPKTPVPDAWLKKLRASYLRCRTRPRLK
jgi:hypothetical protein